MSDNPFAAPTITTPKPQRNQTLRLAERGTRLLAVLTDGAISFLACIPGAAFLALAAANATDNGPDQTMMAIGLILMFVSMIALAIYQIYLLATRAQTIGKKLQKIQVSDVATGRRANFVKCFLMRGFVAALPGAIPILGPIYSIANICFIFRADRKCIHDHIAGTVVTTAEA